MILIYLANAFFSSAFSSQIAAKLITKFNISLYNDLSIPSFESNLADLKTFDLVEFLVFIALFFILTLVTATLVKKVDKTNILSKIYLISSFLIFLQMHFVDSSLKLGMLTYLVIVALISLISRSKPKENKKFEFRLFANGALLGFYLLIFSNYYTTSIAIPLLLFTLTPIIYAVYGKKNNFWQSGSYLFFALSAFYPFSPKVLCLLLIVVLLTSKVLADKKYDLIYKFALIFILTYNPLFNFGNFDSIEEGFWLGWEQRLILGQTPYRDFYLFHPPLLLYGLNIFMKIFDYSMYYSRLYFHLLQIIGVFIVYLVTEKIISNRIIRIVILLLILSFWTTGVRNNVEIRLASGLLPIHLYQYFLKRKDSYFLFSAGFLSAVALLISLEIGIAVSIALIATILVNKDRFAKLRIYGIGYVALLIPFFVYYYFSGSLTPMLSQMNFYMRAFSAGYLNNSVDRSETLTLLQWYEALKYFTSIAWFWEATRIVLVSTLGYVLCMMIGKAVKVRMQIIFALSVFSLILTRSVLGRFDSYHLIFVLPIGLMFLGLWVEKYTKNTAAASLFLVVIGIFFARDATMLGYTQQTLIKYQTYGNPAGSYPSYTIDRTNIIVNIDTDINELQDMVVYLQENTSEKDTVFAYPWQPELYFVANINNATSFDNPLSFYTEDYQRLMIKQLKDSDPKFVVYNPDFSLARLNSGSLGLINDYIVENYTPTTSFGDYRIMQK